jgi:hypothetical protein
VDPAKEVLLDPLLVNPFLIERKESYSCASCTV